MSLYDVIARKGGFRRNKEQVLAETNEEFMDFCKSLTKEFRGIMCLYGRVNEKLYTAGLLLDKGDITAASFEDVDNKKIIYGEDAITQIREHLSGTTGDLEAYTLSDRDMEKMKTKNRETLLKHNIPFPYLGMKIKSGDMKRGGDGIPVRRVGGIEELKAGEDFNLVDFARRFPFTSNKGKIRIPGEGGGIEFNPKKERIAELKRKRQMQNLALTKRISQVGMKKPRGGITEEGKVETSIDRLYQLVQKYERVKIDDKLARRLNVSRSQIENWAVILEEHNLVELHYPAIGEPEIRKVIGEGGQ